MQTPGNPRPSSSAGRRVGMRLLGWFLLLCVLAAVAWFGWLYHQMRFYSGLDDAQQADAIAVFGAAEYSGRPSPVFHARLDKALALYQRGLAPVIVTLGGGSARDDGNTEGAVGRDYLLANGVPNDDIIAETTSVDTEQQVDDLAQLADEHDWHHLDVVSDGTHLFRIHLLCSRAGLSVYTSPREPLGNLDDIDRAQRLLHELISSTSVVLNLHISSLHRWAEGKDD